jgi:ATP synthase subunit 6
MFMVRHLGWWYRTSFKNNKYGSIFYTVILTLWFIIISYNLIGLIPYSFTVTSHMVIGLGLSFPSFILMVVLGFYYHRFFFLSILLPNGVPIYLTPLIVLIELVSLLARIASLAVRLVANLLTGHILIKLVASQFTLPILILVLLELAVAFIQAYVFVLLTLSYINDSLILH